MVKHEINIETCAEYRESMAKAAAVALDYENINYACEINIKVTDDSGIRELNKEYRGQDKVTDVLSFPMMERNPENGAMMLGDVVISGERAREQSRRIGQSYGRELMFLTVHAVLHLLGHDHELSEQHDLSMREKQREIIKLIAGNAALPENNHE